MEVRREILIEAWRSIIGQTSLNLTIICITLSAIRTAEVGLEFIILTDRKQESFTVP